MHNYTQNVIYFDTSPLITLYAGFYTFTYRLYGRSKVNPNKIIIIIIIILMMMTSMLHAKHEDK